MLFKVTKRPVRIKNMINIILRYCTTHYCLLRTMNQYVSVNKMNK